MSKSKALMGLVGAILVFAIFVGFRSWWLSSHGQTIFWLQELWTPTAIVSILVVTFVERLVRPAAPASAPAKRGATKKRKPARKAPPKAKKA